MAVEEESEPSADALPALGTTEARLSRAPPSASAVGGWSLLMVILPRQPQIKRLLIGAHPESAFAPPGALQSRELGVPVEDEDRQEAGAACDGGDENIRG
jgi:hypothetical protein